MYTKIRQKLNKKNLFRLTSYALTVLALIMIILALLPTHFGSGRKQSNIVIRNDKDITISEKSNSTVENIIGISGFVLNGNMKINDLVTKYYAAMVSNDETQLSKYTDDIEAIDELKRIICTEYVEGYENIECYVMQGILENTYIVVAVSDITFKGIQTRVPNIEYLYVCTDLSGNMYVSNKQAGEEVQSYNNMMYSNGVIIERAKKIAAEYDQAISNDDMLNALLISFKELQP